MLRTMAILVAKFKDHSYKVRNCPRLSSARTPQESVFQTQLR
ncbi:hypothetical protein [Loigolactobacillus backii]|nr:hypothetical protein [Loigolactobacillus backii]